MVCPDIFFTLNHSAATNRMVFFSKPDTYKFIQQVIYFNVLLTDNIRDQRFGPQVISSTSIMTANRNGSVDRFHWDRRATLRWGGGGGTISDLILGGGGAGHIFLLNLYNFKNIGGGAHAL